MLKYDVYNVSGILIVQRLNFYLALSILAGIFFNLVFKYVATQQTCRDATDMPNAYSDMPILLGRP